MNFNKLKQAFKNQDHLQIKEFFHTERLFSKFKYQILTYFIINDEINYIKILLKKDIDVNKPNKNNRTALVIAARNGKKDIILLLLENGADLHFANDMALYEAVHLGQIEAVKLLRSCGAKYKENFSDLLSCARRHHNRNKVLDYLLENVPS